MAIKFNKMNRNIYTLLFIYIKKVQQCKRRLQKNREEFSIKVLKHKNIFKLHFTYNLVSFCKLFFSFENIFLTMSIQKVTKIDVNKNLFPKNYLY